MKKIFLSLLLCIVGCTFAQETFPTNGAKDNTTTTYAFTNATIYRDYKTKLEKATLIITDDKIVAIGTDVAIPAYAVKIDLDGKYIYPSFIDLHSDYGMPQAKKGERHQGARPLMASPKDGAYHWNAAIHPEIDAVSIFSPDNKKAEELRKLGFGTVLTHQQDGIARGSGTLVTLGQGNENELILAESASAHYSFRKGASDMDYPSSLMGSIALLRQTHMDAKWYVNLKEKEEVNLSLEAWNKQQNLPQIIEVRDMLEALRADKLGDEFNVQYVIKGAGDEYQRIVEIKKTGASIIVPLNYPEAYDVEDPFDARVVKLSQMMHWDLVPHNAKMLTEAGVEIAFTTSGLKTTSDFMKNLQYSVKYGLSETSALKALTYTPARMIKSSEVGSLDKGKRANFIITSGNIFDEKTKIYENWISGDKFQIEEPKDESHVGKYLLTFHDVSYQLVLGEKSYVLDTKLMDKGIAEDSLKKEQISVSPTLDNELIRFSFSMKNNTDKLLFSGWKTKEGFAGKLNETSDSWKAKRTGDMDNEEEKKEEEEKTDSNTLSALRYPFMGYGWTSQPKQDEIIFKNATVWTNEKEGILSETDVHVKGGKIVAVGKELASTTAKVVEAKGLHLTSGIIDEHSHIAISKGVNEGTQASSAEVRISDVVDSEDINIYRQLAGGVTAAQLLHGSANPIGGQSAIIKLRWGSTPEEMKIKGADGFIKFALGENVKQSNWGEKHNVRFPQTRMGVEAVYYDHFWKAKDYEAAWKKYNNLSTKEKATAVPPRQDLELDALVEILNGKRFITCHSYMQHEINMLMHVADSMGFTVNTFTHILEGYKVADKMKAHGAGGSTFSDWWAYKYEVNDAIPYNAAIMTNMGITTAINSDDAEMGRRLNQEAAKTVKYGGLSEEEAWKTVTLNPAKLLHLDAHMGSVKTGKDADIVLWTDNPLSIYAQVAQTYIDGRKYYDVAENEKKQQQIDEERNRLIQKMLNAKKGGAPTQKPSGEKKILYHCDHLGE